MSLNMNMIRTKTESKNVMGSGRDAPSGHAIAETCVNCGNKHNNQPKQACNRARQLHYAHEAALIENEERELEKAA